MAIENADAIGGTYIDDREEGFYLQKLKWMKLCHILKLNCIFNFKWQINILHQLCLIAKFVQCLNLIEANTIGSGMTANTTAVITAQHDTMYKDMIANNGFDVAKDYLYANLQAVENFKQLVEDEQIDCDFEITPSYLYSHKHSISKFLNVITINYNKNDIAIILCSVINLDNFNTK